MVPATNRVGQSVESGKQQRPFLGKDACSTVSHVRLGATFDRAVVSGLRAMRKIGTSLSFLPRAAPAAFNLTNTFYSARDCDQSPACGPENGAELFMSNLIPMDKAATLLGLSVDRLAEMRSNNEIFGYRDGSSWKFKLQELERVADELGISLKKGGDDSDDFELSDSSGSEPLLLDESEELILDDSSDSGIFQPAGGSIVDEDAPGKKKKGPSDTDKLGVKGPGSSKKMGDDELLLADDDDLSSDFEDSDLLLDDSDSNPDVGTAKGAGAGKGTGASKGAGAGKAAAKGPSKKPSQFDDDDADFALSDDALQLGGSDIDDLELSDDGDMLSLAEAADADAGTLMQEDDFNLTPLETADSEESSGSQVIALDDSDLFTSGSDATQLQSGEAFDAADAAPLDGGLDSGISPAVAPQVVQVPAADAPFSLWQVLSLGLLMAILLPGGMIAYDLCRNLWMPEGTTISTGVLPWILELFQ